jgi:hypothetical protein
MSESTAGSITQPHVRAASAPDVVIETTNSDKQQQDTPSESGTAAATQDGAQGQQIKLGICAMDRKARISCQDC